MNWEQNKYVSIRYRKGGHNMQIKITKEEANIMYHALHNYLYNITDEYISEPDPERKDALDDLTMKIEGCLDKVFVDDQEVFKMFRVFIYINNEWIVYSNNAWGCELDALEEYTKARLEGYIAKIEEV